jgi:hypothetical protein
MEGVSIWLDASGEPPDRDVRRWIECGTVTGIGPSGPAGRRRAARWARWLRDAHERSQGADGLVQADAALAARNSLIALELTPAGLLALERLVAAGRSAAIGPLLSVDDARAAAERHMRGLERRLAAGRPLAGIVSLAWCRVDVVDARADAQLDAAPELRGWVGPALAQLTYAECYRLLAGPRWERLRAAGALRQRPALRAANPAQLARLALPGAVVAVDGDAMRVVGQIAPCPEPDETEAAWVLAEARRAGVELRPAPLPLRAASPRR